MKTTYLYFLAIFIFSSFNSCQHKEISKPFYDYDIEAKLDSLGIELSNPKPPVANYVHVVQTGKLLFLAGKGPKDKFGNNIVGRLGEDMTIEEGYNAARRIGIAQLSVLKSHLGDLNKVKRIVKIGHG